MTIIRVWLAAALLGVTIAAVAEEGGGAFDDRPRATLLEHPDWFTETLFDLPDDLARAVAAGKRGLMVYVGQRRCAYCHLLMDEVFGQADIRDYTRRHFDVVALDAWGVAEVTAIDGAVLSERALALREQADFTPTILFYDAAGRLALRLRGYYPPYQFRAALEYVADAHYRDESFRDYLARGDNRLVFELDALNEADFFQPPPHNLDRRFPAERPLAVFFERGECHACDVLHGQVLRGTGLDASFTRIDAVQLDMDAPTPVITPDGRRVRARDWAAELGLFYAPSVLFFDERGRELLRVDSVASFYRLGRVLEYIDSRAYRDLPYGRWRARVETPGE
ncbi:MULTISPECIES: thioredoxin fold domain-containing protein [Marichromatium]|uniref:Thioredoxin-related protein n=1 Tax=Marichromatium gracile TaxID=1048 RepID=A0A4R4ACY3_MARGR|nr:MULTISPECIES: thioredoxin fold domain-containing protein [Marichromatium]MBK1709956.1 thioredoxin [Marichromatium gracile]RNE91617.1 thioredoxin [Marichromatium sp. AB31]TCW36907.1 thioredoxin-related protein [Marichromatium gracile]